MFKLEPAITAMIDATNRGDTEAFLAGFDDGATVVDFGRTFSGKCAIARWDGNNAGGGSLSSPASSSWPRPNIASRYLGRRRGLRRFTARQRAADGFCPNGQVAAEILTGDIAVAGTAVTTVFNPWPGGGSYQLLDVLELHSFSFPTDDVDSTVLFTRS